jgi:hypothetical protein
MISIALNRRRCLRGRGRDAIMMISGGSSGNNSGSSGNRSLKVRLDNSFGGCRANSYVPDREYCKLLWRQMGYILPIGNIYLYPGPKLA